jgi:hypothetical protein
MILLLKNYILRLSQNAGYWNHKFELSKKWTIERFLEAFSEARSETPPGSETDSGIARTVLR